MKKLLLSFVFMMMGALFFILPASADNIFQTALGSGDVVQVTLSNGYYNVTLDPGQRYYFTWSVMNNGGASNIVVDGISAVYAGSSFSFIDSTASVDVSNGTSGFAEFVNIGPASYTVDLSVSVSFNLRNNNNSTATPRIQLTVGNGQYLSSDFVTNNQLNSKLNEILDSLGVSAGGHDFLGPDAVYFDNRFFDVLYGNGTRSFNSDGFISVSGSTDVRPCAQNGNRLPGIYFSPGDYVFVIGYPGDDVSNSCTLVFPYNPDISITEQYSGVSQGNNVSVVWRVFQISFDQYYSSPYFQITFDQAITGILYGGYITLPLDSAADQVITDEFNDKVDEVDNAGQQQAQQEEDTWNNINSYKGDLEFSIDWSEAASGLSYVSGIFMMIWDNSPTEIITLSLMLGIAMLGIGRGVQAAIRSSRSSGRKGGGDSA